MKKSLFLLLIVFCFSCKQAKKTETTSKNIKVENKDSINPWVINNPNALDLFEELSEQESDSLSEFLKEYLHEFFDEYKIKYKSKDTLVDFYFIENNVLDIEFNYPEFSKELIEDSLIFKNDSIKFEIIKEKFMTSNYEISRDSIGYTDLINNKMPYGIDGGLPKVNIKSIDFYLNNKKVSINKTNFEDLFEPNFKSAKLYLTDFNEFIFTSWNSDGAGGYYLVLFINQDGKTTRIISIP